MEANSFIYADYTAIVSDLHLCEAEAVNPKYPLWKKFKTRQFFFDDTFENFLKHITQKAGGKKVELILNGDIFDFDSVLSTPEDPVFRVSWLERKSGLYPRPERAKYKIDVILRDHSHFVRALRSFIVEGHRAIFIIGNHDLELHFSVVQEAILQALNLNQEQLKNVRFADWFYISNKDTLIEHGNQYDPYCVCEDPINPFAQGYNYKSVRLPFGNLACRYIMNGMGFFNPHVESNYIMDLKEYVTFFLKYMARAQPLIILTWFWGSLVTLFMTLADRFRTPSKEPFQIEDRVNALAYRANAEPRMVREMKELFVNPASANPLLLARELWLDRAFIILIAFFVLFEAMMLVKQFYSISFFWVFIPILLFLPFFLFYSQSFISKVSTYKEPDEKTMAVSSAIAKVNRIVYGHTHIVRHEMIGAVEHLNSGCWSPAFLDVECTKAFDQKTFVWIEPDLVHQKRKSQVLIFENNTSKDALHRRPA